MVSPGVLGALAGFLGALVTLGIPLVKYLRHIDQQASQSYRLLTGEDEVEDDGVIPRLRTVELRSAEHRIALQESEVEVPDLEGEDKVLADGGVPTDE